jgi:hypothetical protein
MGERRVAESGSPREPPPSCGEKRWGLMVARGVAASLPRIAALLSRRSDVRKEDDGA